MVANKAFVYKSLPHGIPVKGQDLVVEPREDFDVEMDPPANGLTVKNLFASYDPTQRGQMRDPSIKLYSQPFLPNDKITSINIVSRVLKSNHDGIPSGSILQLWVWPTEMYSIVSGEDISSGRARLMKNTEGVPLTAFAGSLGMSGMTAYGGLRELAQAKAGDVLFVSAASGAVGQIVGQIAVREGLKVIGSVGDDRKLKHIESLGLTGFNYKAEDVFSALKRLAPDGLDIYWDNVGGSHLDAALENMKVFGRVVGCGSISDYNAKPGESYRLANYDAVWKKRLAFNGFVICLLRSTSLANHYLNSMLVSDPNIIQHQDARDGDITRWLREGSMTHEEHIVDGIDNAVDGFLGMLLGHHFGKSILKIHHE